MFTTQPVEVFNYYAYGMMIPGFFSNASPDYRFGFNGMLRDDDVRDEKLTSDNEGRGNSYSTEYRFYDNRAGRWLSIDPLASKFPWSSPYVAMGNNPVIYVDPDGRDAEIKIDGNFIKITSDIYLYGEGASKKVVDEMEKTINNEWNNFGKGWKYFDNDLKEEFFIEIMVNIRLLDEEDPTTNPQIIFDSFNPFSSNNYIDLTNLDMRSFVLGDDEGSWSSRAQKKEYTHEFGHILGLIDHYYDKGEYSYSEIGWEGNIMSGKTDQNNKIIDWGEVELRNIITIINPYIKIVKNHLNNNNYNHHKQNTKLQDIDIKFKIDND